MFEPEHDETLKKTLVPNEESALASAKSDFLCVFYG